jgi:hypothetical protein
MPLYVVSMCTSIEWSLVSTEMRIYAGVFTLGQSIISVGHAINKIDLALDYSCHFDHNCKHHLRFGDLFGETLGETEPESGDPMLA